MFRRPVVIHYFRTPELSAADIAPTSQVRASATLLLQTGANSEVRRNVSTKFREYQPTG
jgi:hypothetical protein